MQAAHAHIRQLTDPGSRFDGTTDYKVMATPAVVGAVTIAGECATEIRCSEGGDVFCHAHRHRCVVEGLERIRKGLVQAGLLVIGHGVQVEGAERHKEHLALYLERSPGSNHPRHQIELRGQAVARHKGHREVVDAVRALDLRTSHLLRSLARPGLLGEEDNA